MLGGVRGGGGGLVGGYSHEVGSRNHDHLYIFLELSQLKSRFILKAKKKKKI